MSRRHVWISLFVIVWISLFHYETLRLRYLSPLVGHELPKLKGLYPPAGWIMFFNVDRTYGMAEVYGLQRPSDFIQGAIPSGVEGQPTYHPVLLDPHTIFATRFLLYDNIRRNVLISVLSPSRAKDFCQFLTRKFPSYERFAVVYAQYPDVADRPTDVQRQLAYRCP